MRYKLRFVQMRPQPSRRCRLGWFFSVGLACSSLERTHCFRSRPALRFPSPVFIPDLRRGGCAAEDFAARRLRFRLALRRISSPVSPQLCFANNLLGLFVRIWRLF